MESFKAKVISPLDVKSSHEVRLQQELVEAKRELQSMSTVGRKFRKTNKSSIKKRIKSLENMLRIGRSKGFSAYKALATF